MEIFLPVVVLGSLGLIFGLWLAFVQKIFEVKKDPRIEHVFSLLPGSNCGACGKAGCLGLAEALAQGETRSITCPVANENERKEIAEVLGLKVDRKLKQVATLICGGGINCNNKFYYHGHKDCDIATIVMDGPKACIFGCVSFGSCVKVCPFDAILMGSDGLPHIDIEKCTGCGKCIKLCPKDILVLTPITSRYHIQCNSTERGPDVIKACKIGCIGCGKCVKICPASAITLNDNLAKIDYEKCTNCGECINVCPTKAIGRRKKDG